MDKLNQVIRRTRDIVCCAVFSLLILSCGDEPPESGFYFAGYVHNGVTGEPIYNYSLELLYYDVTLSASVDSDGRYLVGPLEQGHDFTIKIDADGYRPFSSHNQWYAAGGCDNPCVFQSEIFDAYLFPLGLEVPETTFSIYVDDSLERPSGTLRLRPTTASDLFDEPSEMPASVTDIWQNDEDLLNGTVVVPIEEGVATVPAGELIYGVTYDLTVYAVPGYQYTSGEPFTAGLDESGFIIVSRREGFPLQLVFSTTQLGAAEDAIVILVFNQPVVFDAVNTTNYYEEVIDDNVSIVSYDDDDDNDMNILETDEDEAVQERGTSISISENQITLEWSTSGLDSRDSDDRIRAVTFGGLDGVFIHPVGALGGSSSLGDLVGPSVTVQLLP